MTSNIIIEDISYSYSKVIAPNDIKLSIMNALSFYLPGYQFMPSVRRGLFDGKKRFYMIDNSDLYIPYGLKDMVVEFIKDKYNIDVTYKKKPLLFNFDIKEFKEWFKTLKLPYKLRDYQLKMVVHGLLTQRLIMQSCTGSGKSLVLYIILRYLFEHNYKVMLLVPAISLLEQMNSDFKEYLQFETDDIKEKFLSSYGLIGGEHRDKNFDLSIITTYASARLFDKSIFNLYDAMIWDEAHLAKSEESEAILYASLEVPFRLGLTGTVPTETIQNISLKATLGNVKVYITPRELIDRGLATDVEVQGIFLNYKEKVPRLKYHEELKFIEAHNNRNDFVVKLTNRVASKYGNTILLYKHTEHGIMLWKNLVKERLNMDNIEFNNLDLNKIKNNIELQKQYKVFFINGSVKGKVREKIRNILEEYNDAIIVSLYSIMGTGINIKKLHCIILAASTKSDITIIQTIGRGLRKHASKDIFRLFDIVDVFKRKNYMVKHFESRLKNYINEGYNILEKHFEILPDIKNDKLGGQK